jgi:SAM-dependent methyltransferase
MYSPEWFETFSGNVPAEIRALELDDIQGMAPPGAFPHVLDIGCGVGRIAAGLAERGYHVTGIDVSEHAVHTARARVPSGRFVQLDQRHVGRLGGPFDLVLVMWHSLGFNTRHNDQQMLWDIARLVRSGGMFVLDLFHPEWLSAHQLDAHQDPRGAVIDRHVRSGRCVHRIAYPSGSIDHIEFQLYAPEEMSAMLRSAGFAVEALMAWWKRDVPASADHARFQVICRRSPALPH